MGDVDKSVDVDRSDNQVSQDRVEDQVRDKVSASLGAPISKKGAQVLKGALQVFLERGYVGASMDRIAAVAGVSKATVYSHFRDKEGLSEPWCSASR